MGWTGEPEEKKEEEKIVPRDARLGLGAMSRPPDEKKKGHKGDKHSKNDKNDKYEKNKKVWEKQAKERKKQVINEDDLVMLLDVNYAGKRGSVVAVRGVPGLDRIRICLESNGKSVEIKRTDAVLLSAGDLLENPYNGVKAQNIENGPTFFGLKPKSGDDKGDKGEKGENADRNRNNRSDESGRNDRNDRNKKNDKNERNDRSEKDSDRNESRKRNIDEVDRGRGENNRDSHREKDRESNRDRDRDRERDRDRNDDRRYEDEKDKKRSKENKDNDKWVSDHSVSDFKREKNNNGIKEEKYNIHSSKNNNNNSNNKKNNDNDNDNNKINNRSNRDDKNNKSWLMTGIRVKIISQKHYKKYYKMKASVVDVPGIGIGE